LKRTIGTLFLIAGLAAGSAPASAISFGNIGYGAGDSLSNMQGRMDERDNKSMPDISKMSPRQFEKYMEGRDTEVRNRSNKDFDKRHPENRQFQRERPISFSGSDAFRGGVGGAAGQADNDIGRDTGGD
jgi:hypothetical protein